MGRLSVGSMVRLTRRREAGRGAYRVEQLLELADGGTLYRVKCDAEPFHRIVSERDVARRPAVEANV
jgi:hypothetical protein